MFEIIHLSSKASDPIAVERLCEAINLAEKRNLRRYRIDELPRDGGRVTRIQIGST